MSPANRSDSGSASDTSPLGTSGRHDAEYYTTTQGDGRPLKRLRTRKACTHCKQRKIRCDFDSAAVGHPCKRCASYGLPCDVNGGADREKLPIPRSPRRGSASPRRRSPAGDPYGSIDASPHDEEEGPAYVPDGTSREFVVHSRYHTHIRSRRSSSTPPPSTVFAPIAKVSGEQTATAPESSLSATSGIRQVLEGRVYGSHFGRPDPRLLGATSMSALLTPISRDGKHSSALFSHDMRYGLRRRETILEESTVIWSLNGSSPVWRLPSHRLTLPIIEKLLDHYAKNISPIFPAIMYFEATNLRTLTAFQILAMCAIASLSRTVPQPISASVRSRLYHLLEAVPGGSIWTSNQANLTALLVMSMSSELHGITASAGGSIAWLRTGVAIRMAQDLGYHRKITDFGVSASQRRVRSRLWALCMMTDAWYALSYGQPLMVDATAVDAEAFIPLRSDEEESGPCCNQKTVFYMSQLTTILRRVLRTVYDVSHAPLAMATDDTLVDMCRDIDHFHANLPERIVLRPDTDEKRYGAAVVALASEAIEYVFYRPFKYRHSLPKHIEFQVTPERWSQLIERSHRTIAWIAKHGSNLLDSWFVVMYSMSYSAQMHFYNYVDSRDAASLHTLQTITEIFDTWASGQGDTYEATSLRYRTSDLVSQLYTAAVDGCTDTRVQAMQSTLSTVIPGLQDPPQQVPGLDFNTTDPLSELYMLTGTDPNLIHPTATMNDDWSTLLNFMGANVDFSTECNL
ncbi:hypothetical protein Q8F55_007374 [Vanrija albida]|uniref:Zn(2)-C6 fungal-type domain-containing protein n=1 Tax=Vanrija albida TaxID=181172 RepID=A0ABR3PTC6_9TREE